jgi:hypothetical protein
MKASDFVKKLRDVAMKYKTLYVMGCFGDTMTAANKQRYINHHSYNQSATRVKMIKNASADTFGFDCVCLIKAILWGWTGDKNASYGGAVYASNGVPDIDADSMFNVCTGKSTDFSNIEVGEAVWTNGHIGVYIGNGLAVECTPAWANCVQITACNKAKTGFKTRNWKKHGKLPYIEYDVKKSTTTTTSSTAKKSVDEIAKEVIAGKWYNGAARKSALTKAGYDYNAVQKRVDEILSGADKAPAKKSIEEIAKEVIEGKWYNGAARKSALTKAGYDYAAVQAKVDELLAPKKTNTKSVDELAREVIQGKWGNGAARKSALTKAGYDYNAVQKRVDELLS